MIKSGISLARQPDMRDQALADAAPEFPCQCAACNNSRPRCAAVDEPDEIFVAGLVLRQQAEMMINVARAAALFFFQPRAGRDINLAADDGLDAFCAGGLIKLNRRRASRRGR